MSARRVELVQGGSGSGRARRVSKLSLGEVGRAQELEQAKIAVHVVVERDRGEQQQVPSEPRDRRDRPPRRMARVPEGVAQAMGLVDHQQIDARVHGSRAELGVRHERLERDHGAAVTSNGFMPWP